MLWNAVQVRHVVGTTLRNYGDFGAMYRIPFARPWQYHIRLKIRRVTSGHSRCAVPQSQQRFILTCILLLDVFSKKTSLQASRCDDRINCWRRRLRYNINIGGKTRKDVQADIVWVASSTCRSTWNSMRRKNETKLEQSSLDKVIIILIIYHARRFEYRPDGGDLRSDRFCWFFRHDRDWVSYTVERTHRNLLIP
jgi:hypothetical protein